MYLFGKKNTVLVIGGMVLCHLLVAALCAFWIYRFLVVTYDPAVFLLLGLFVGAIIFCDVLAAKVQAFSRFLVRCRVDSDGIYCACLWKRWSIKWSDVHIFGITGFSSLAQTGIVFLSKDLREKYQQNKLTLVTSNRIAFSLDERRWDKFSNHMPTEIKRKLQRAIDNNRDCYYRR